MTNKEITNILAIDTSTRILKLGLQYSGDRMIKLAEPVDNSHGQILFRKIEDLFESANRHLQDLHGIVVCTGPGSFTGLRIALAAAKGIAVALDIPVVGLSLFEIAEYKLKDDPATYKLLVPYIREEFFITQRIDNQFKKENTTTIKLDKLAEISATSKIVAINLDIDPSMINNKKTNFTLIDYETNELLQLGLEKLLKGEIENLADLEPMYIKKSQAEINFEQRNKQ